MNDAIRQLRLENDRLRTQIARLESGVRQAWIGPGIQLNPTLALLRVVGGNDILTIGSATWTGIKYVGTTIASVPTVTPLNLTTYADGLGYGYVRNSGGDTGPLVWICNATMALAAGGTATAAVNNTVSTNQLVSSVNLATVNCAAGGTATVYIISRAG